MAQNPGSSSADIELADFDALFQRERQPMLRMASLILSSGVLAEEVVQDAFVVVNERWSDLENPGGYLRATVVNGCRQSLRRREIEQRHSVSTMPAPTYDAPEQLLDLRDALDQLSERQRVAVVLRYFSDLPDQEIAQALNCRPSTVRSLIRRGLTALRKELQ